MKNNLFKIECQKDNLSLLSRFVPGSLQRCCVTESGSDSQEKEKEKEKQKGKKDKQKKDKNEGGKASRSKQKQTKEDDSDEDLKKKRKKKKKDAEEEDDVEENDEGQEVFGLHGGRDEDDDMNDGTGGAPEVRTRKPAKKPSVQKAPKETKTKKTKSSSKPKKSRKEDDGLDSKDLGELKDLAIQAIAESNVREDEQKKEAVEVDGSSSNSVPEDPSKLNVFVSSLL